MVEFDPVLEHRVRQSLYWKLNCYTLNAAGICEKAAEIRAVGGIESNARPLPFLCLLYKLVLIEPSRPIVEEMLTQPYFKYLTAIAAVFVRLAYDPITVHKLLEPLFADYRKLRLQTPQGLELWHIDELIESLLGDGRIFGLTLPRMPSRITLEDVGLEPREALV